MYISGKKTYLRIFSFLFDQNRGNNKGETNEKCRSLSMGPIESIQHSSDLTTCQHKWRYATSSDYRSSDYPISPMSNWQCKMDPLEWLPQHPECHQASPDVHVPLPLRHLNLRLLSGTSKQKLTTTASWSIHKESLAEALFWELILGPYICLNGEVCLDAYENQWHS